MTAIWRRGALVARRYNSSLSASHAEKKASKRLQIPGFCFDIDGVIVQGKTVLPEAKQALTLLNERKLPWILNTNGGGVHESDRIKLLEEEIGLPVALNQLLQAHTPMSDYPQTKKWADKPVLIIGCEGEVGRTIAQQYGFNKAYVAQDVMRWRRDFFPLSPAVDPLPDAGTAQDMSEVEFAAILVFHDSRDWGRDLQLIVDIASSKNGRMLEPKESITGRNGPDKDQIPVIFSNPDLIYKSSYPLPRFGQGAFQSAARTIFRQVTGRGLRFQSLGKPTPATYKHAAGMIKALTWHRMYEVNQIYMVGDNPASDIQGANNAGELWTSMLVETGVYSKAHGKPKYEPDHICANILEAVELALKKEGQLELNVERVKHIEELETRARGAEAGRRKLQSEAQGDGEVQRRKQSKAEESLWNADALPAGAISEALEKLDEK